MKPLTSFLALYLCFNLIPVLQAYNASGEISHESRYYPDIGAYGNNNQEEVSLVLKGEISHSWDEDRKVFTFIPFLRVSNPDQERSHFDVRELSFVGSWDRLELRAGISKVFWGVTESLHLVDIVNQTDFVENSDGEDKLGQPMINATWVSDYGNFSYFLLPFFRERTFTGVNGRFRTPSPVDTGRPIYIDDAEEKHIDHAFRYSHYWGDLEFGVSFFSGTDREPLFNFNATGVQPKYVQSEQVGIDAQYVMESWLFKFEAIRRDRSLKREFHAVVTGFEYTFFNINKGIDIGAIWEFQYDDRGRNGQALFDDHSFFASRVAFNDELGTEFLVGGSFSHEEGAFQSFRLEASRRINNNWKWELEASYLFNTESGQLLNFFDQDDYIQGTITYYY